MDLIPKPAMASDEGAEFDASVGEECSVIVRPRADNKNAQPRRQPPYAVIIHNDDRHTFDYVIELLQRVFGHPLTKAVNLTCDIHNTGQALVWSGVMEVAELKRDQVRGYGTDFYATTPVRFPLGVTIEPLPQ